MEFIKKNTEQINNDKAIKLAKEFNLHEDVVKLLFLRGIDTKEAIDKYINAGETQLYNPFLLKNMKDLINKLKNAIEKVHQSNDKVSKKAIMWKDEVLTIMTDLRTVVDRLETKVDNKYWPMPTYIDLLFSA